MADNLWGNLTPRNPAGEGSGKARTSWMAWAIRQIEEDDVNFFSPFTSKSVTIDAADRKAIATAAREFSEMVGFWVAWHSTGGFDRLEDHGWSRATIYRKIKRFKEHFGEHPDDYEFDWIDLKHDQAWDAGVVHIFNYLWPDDAEDETP